MGESQSAVVAARLEIARKDLLDLTFRNPLLNYRLLKARGLELADTSPEQLFRMLVVEGKKLGFVAIKDHAEPLDESNSSALEEVTDDDFSVEKPTAVRSRSSVEIAVAYRPNELQKRLLNTYYTSKTLIEEQGLNSLYVALGILRWYEDDNSEQFHRSPLILVPVELDRGSIGEQFQLKYDEHEIGDNPSLALLMRNEHGVIFPDLQAVEDFSLTSYFEQIQNLCKNKKRWEVDAKSALLGFFSFSKYQMYKDLEPIAWPEEDQPYDHPLIQALLGEGFRDLPSDFSDETDLDSLIDVASTHTVMDADSSQSIAVLDALSGRNMVIQGPPGTGKSQTITNIIAEALANGKRILFVAEKMAALEVVKSRLTSLELGDTCLELHSNKANKKAVLTDLLRTLNLNQPVVSDRDDDVVILQSTQNRLNGYASSIRTQVGKSRLKVQEVFGEYYALEHLDVEPEAPRILLVDPADWLPVDYKQREILVRELESHVLQMGPPNLHAFWGSTRESSTPVLAEDIRQKCIRASVALSNLREAGDHLASDLKLKPPAMMATTQTIVDLLRRAMLAPPHQGVLLDNSAWLSKRKEIEDLLSLGERLVSLRSQVNKIFLSESLQTDVRNLRQTIFETGSQWWKVLSPRWRSSQKSLSLMRITPKTSMQTAQQLQSLDSLMEFQEILAIFEKKQSVGLNLFGVQWQGDASNWQALRAISSWVTDLITDVQGGKLPKNVLDFLKGNPSFTGFESTLTALENLLSRFRSDIEAVVDVVRFDGSLRFGSGSHLVSKLFSEIELVLSQWSSASDSIAQIAKFNHLRAECLTLNLGSVVNYASSVMQTPGNLNTRFRQAYIRELMAVAFAEHPTLGTFSGTAHEQLIHQFRLQDKNHLKNNRAKIARVHWDNLPSLSGDGQLRVLRREFEKKSRHLPIRKLMTEAGRAIQAIKPVFMMSPLSIAAYIAPGVLEFDLVIFDEASQVRPVDAIGALLRGKQAVVVGDSKQLPPTSFFDNVTSDENHDEDDVTSDLESVLGLFVAQGASERMLQWHYRSKHESLIAVSNQEFYDNALIIFPSPDSGRHNFGLHFHYLPDTIYDRGKSSTNRAEARVVAESVIAHAKRQIATGQSHWLSLGVAAFSMTQKEAILSEVEALRKQNPECEEFFASSRYESFFVKNLENVQGDERDVIYISVGYGKDSFGKVSMNFGPLNGIGGARRLNVLITRAKLRCEVFTNLTSDDIDITPNSSAGLKSFKNFLQYAQTGHLSMSVPTGRDPDSPFEREVIRLLRSMNFDVVPQVGCAGYFIDMAVKDPRQPGRYLIGVECDGRTYHSSKSARDRDRLRDQVLVAQGWRLHRIWSTDWIKQPAAEARRLKASIELALQDSESVAALHEVIPVVAPQSQSETVTRIASDRAISAIPDYILSEPTSVYQIAGGYYEPSIMLRLVTEVLTQESPVHVTEIAKRIAEAAGIGRVSEKLRWSVDQAISRAELEGTILTRGNFAWRAEMMVPPVRKRDKLSTNARRLEWISPEEIQAAVLHCIEQSFGMSASDVPKAVVKTLLGFERLSRENKDAVDEQINVLINSGMLLIVNGQARLPS